MHRILIVNYFTCDKSTNVHRMVIINYFNCDKSTNVYRMVTVNYCTCDKSVQWGKKSLSQISNSESCARKFLKCRILSMSSVSFTSPGDGGLPHPQVGGGTPVKRFLISLYSKAKSKSVETTETWPPESNIQDECSFSVKQYKKISHTHKTRRGKTYIYGHKPIENAFRGRRGRDRIVVVFTATYAFSAYHNWSCEFESRSGRGVQHNVIKFVSDLWQVGCFLQVLRFPPPIKLSTTISLKYCWKWR